MCKLNAQSYRVQLHVRRKLHDEAPIVLNEFGVSCTDPANCPRGRHFNSSFTAIVHVGLWLVTGRQIDIFTYLSPWHCTLQNFLLNEERILNFLGEPFAFSCVLTVNVLQLWFQITDTDILLIIIIIVVIISIISIIYSHGVLILLIFFTRRVLRST